MLSAFDQLKEDQNRRSDTKKGIHYIYVFTKNSFQKSSMTGNLTNKQSFHFVARLIRGLRRYKDTKMNSI